MDGPQPVALASGEGNAGRIVKLLEDGIDCGVKSPFRLSLSIPKKDLYLTHRTKFYDLQQIPGVQVGLRYEYVIPDRWALDYSRILVCIFDPKNNRQEYGVQAEVVLNRDIDNIPIKSFGAKHPQAETFNFEANLRHPDVFIYDVENNNDLEIVVSGAVFYWDEARLMRREQWRFGYGVEGLVDGWLPENAFDLEFIARDGTRFSAHSEVLRRTNARIAEMLSENPGPFHTQYQVDVIKAGVRLLYSYHIVGRLAFEQKLELLLFCDEFQMSEYKDQLEEHLSEYIDAVEIGKITRYAINANANLLKQRCLEFLRECFRTHTFFSGLNDDDFTLLIMEAAINENWPDHWDSPPFQQD